jgi:hypothetical protein
VFSHDRQVVMAKEDRFRAGLGPRAVSGHVSPVVTKIIRVHWAHHKKSISQCSTSLSCVLSSVVFTGSDWLSLSAMLAEKSEPVSFAFSSS